MESFKQLTLEEREKLSTWKEQGVSFREIGRRLGRSHTSLAREMKRNKTGRGYRSNEYLTFSYVPCKADAKAKRRAAGQRRKAPLKCPLVFLYVREHLRSPYSWSPEEIEGRLPIECAGYSIDDETIYRYIHGSKQTRMKLWRYLTRHHRKRQKHHGRKVTSVGVNTALSITKRPKYIQKRKQPGHWETDNMEGKKSDRTGISVTVERRTRIYRLAKLSNHTAKTKTKALLEQFSKESSVFTRTMTGDGGPENRDGGLFHQKTGIPVYRTTPYHSWEKGTVENSIGRLRRFIPKGTSVDGITQSMLDSIQDRMNNTPRKCLKFLTPNEAYAKILSASYIF